MFRTANPFEAQVAKATGEDLVTENWELFMNICDRIGRSETNARDCMAAIQKRMLHRNANVVLYTLSLTDALAKNCGKTAQREISSRAFTSTLVRVLNDKSVHEVVKKHTLEYIQQWAFEFRSDPDLGLMEEVYHELQAQNFQFPSPQKPEKVPAKKELQRQKEEDELQLAIALSLSENEAQKQQHSSTIPKPPVASTSQAKATGSTYPSPSSIAVPHGVQQGNQRGPAARVKALFDFQATEPGELGFFKGDIIDVLDQKYKDWWKGRLRTQTGIFPANYVQLIREPSPSDLAKEYETETRVLNSAQQVDQLLQLLDTIDPRVGNISENEPLQSLYHDVLTLRPMLIQLIEKYTQKRDEMIALNEKFNRTVQMYDSVLSTNTGQYGQSAGNRVPPPQQQAMYAQPMPNSGQSAPNVHHLAPPGVANVMPVHPGHISHTAIPQSYTSTPAQAAAPCPPTTYNSSNPMPQPPTAQTYYPTPATAQTYYTYPPGQEVPATVQQPVPAPTPSTQNYPPMQ